MPSNPTSCEPAPTPPDDEDEYDGDRWCIDCGDEFHYDDCGGYNPPCECGFHCRSCHDAEALREEDDPDDEFCDVCDEWFDECECHQPENPDV